MSDWAGIEKAGRYATKSPKKAPRRKAKSPAAPKSKCIVYALTGADGVVCYVGQTRSPLQTRLDYHKRNALITRTSPVAKWIIANKADVRIIILDNNATWDVSEILWIDRYRREGHHLWNVTRGGPDTLADVMREGCFPKSHEEIAKAAKRKAVAARAEAMGIDLVQPLPT